MTFNNNKEFQTYNDCIADRITPATFSSQNIGRALESLLKISKTTCNIPLIIVDVEKYCMQSSINFLIGN